LSHPDDTHLTPSQKHGVLAQADYMALTGNKVVLNLNGSDAMRHVEPRDFISHLRSFQGGLELSRLKGKVSAAYTVLTPRRGVVASYFRYVFKSVMYVQALQTTTDQLRDGQSIRYGQFALIPMAVPPVAEQQQIADYLDAHTAKIDVLIEKQERLIETLAERRQAVISHAVTKGLDPSAPMKESGVQALGHIPSHWAVSPLRHVISSVGSGTSVNALDVEPDKGDIGVLKTSCVYTGDFDVRQAKSVDPDELSRVTCPVKANRLIVSRMNTPSLVGAAGLTTHDSPSTYLPDRLWQVEFNQVEPEFVHQWTKTFSYRGQVSVVCVGTSSSMQNLSQGDFRSFQMPLPPADEQLNICRYLNRETAQIDALSAKAREMIDVLKERREALISAAVTGKIDVRGLS
jgi:type I restriction enzyme S subunit